ncbi:MAG: PINc/VapC family ATPase [Desulfurococcales archaeon]|nr:PINc/VapC family ATPase [Desulfurococcales archaeon]
MADGTYVLDVDSILDGSARRLIVEGSLSGRILIHRIVIDYFYREARVGRSAGFTGLEELSKIREAAPRGSAEFTIIEEEKLYPKDVDVDQVKKTLLSYAWRSGAVLVTSDPLLARAARAMGVSVFLSRKVGPGKLGIEEFFTDKTMSVHLKEGVIPIAKVGRPGRWAFVAISDKPLKRSDIEDIAREIIEAASLAEDGFIEIDRMGSTIIQLRDYRIVITRPPLSDGWEVTAVRPIVKLKLSDYNVPEKLLKRFLERAEGILIAGAPGMGKTTFAQALAEFYSERGKIVKTIESPRDMRLPPEITQYSKSYADLGELHDILLLSRPDYTVFDELRTDEDFKLYVDLRLAGIGMIGVVHATEPIDAIQRFIRRVELGMIPSIIDTMIFIHEGSISKVYELAMTVKLPTGLKEAELSRPVVEVRDFLTGELEYEIYTFGEQTMVVPVKGKTREAQKGALETQLKKLLPDAEIEFEDMRVILKIPRYSTKLTAKKLKRAKRLAEKHGFDIRIIPI